MTRGSKHAKVPDRQAEEGIPRQSESSIRDTQPDGGNEGTKGDKVGETDGPQTRGEVEPPVLPQYVQELIERAKEASVVVAGPPNPPLPFTERWRDKVNGMTYRVIVYRAFSFMPERISLERLISQGSEPETWTAEVMPA